MKTDKSLIYRYLNICGEPDPASSERIDTLCGSMEAVLTPGYVFRVFPLMEEENGFLLGEHGPLLNGHSAKRLLTGCQRAAVLTATLGFAFEKMLSAAQKRDMAEAVILDACASAYIETVADEAEEEIKKRAGGYLTDRFSPGYGDLPLSLQPELIRLADAEKRLGVHVLDSMLLTPVKTITALIGLAESPRPAMVRGCAYCSMQKTCPYKKGTGHCEFQR